MAQPGFNRQFSVCRVSTYCMQTLTRSPRSFHTSNQNEEESDFVPSAIMTLNEEEKYELVFAHLQHLQLINDIPWSRFVCVDVFNG